MRPKLRRVKQRGLTLVELLVAISVLGFVAVLGWRGLDSIVRARIALTSALDETRGMQLTFAQLQSDCSHLATSLVLPNRTPIAIKPGRIALVRTVFADNQPSRLQIITYQLKNNVLSRSESTATRDLKELDMLWLSVVNDADTADEVVLQSDVTSMTMLQWIDGSWTAAPPAQPQGSSPTGLEVTLKLRGSDTSILKIFLLGAV